MTHTPPARPVVVVLGGGYAGVQVARPLDDLADVVLVEPKDHFVHNVAALRALVDRPGWSASTCRTPRYWARAG
jgi:NADH dehydrogenase FAD-containing subunit